MQFDVDEIFFLIPLVRKGVFPNPNPKSIKKYPCTCGQGLNEQAACFTETSFAAYLVTSDILQEAEPGGGQ